MLQQSRGGLCKLVSAIYRLKVQIVELSRQKPSAYVIRILLLIAVTVVVELLKLWARLLVMRALVESTAARRSARLSIVVVVVIQ